MGQSQSKEAKRPARALSPVRGLNRQGVDHPIPPPRNPNAFSKSVVPTDVQSPPLEDIAKAVGDTANAAAKKDSSPPMELKFPEGTLGTEIQSQPLDDLAKAFEAMIAKMAEASGSDLETAYFIKQIDDITLKASDFSANAQAFLAAVPNVSSKVNETIDHVMATIDGIASAHPILKIAWIIVSAGYKMISDASKVNQEYLELPGQFQAILEYVSDFLNRPIKGIADKNTRKSLVEASECIILCLTDAALLFTEYMDTPGATWSNITGSNKNKLDEMKARLADVQEAHQSAKDKGLFTIVVTVASDVVDIKTDVAELKMLMQSQAVESKLQQLCQKRDPHRAEVTTLVNRCAKGTRKWIVDQALESIENGAEKITWLRCEAGTGKSVIAGCVAQELKQKGLLGATFFCKFNNTMRENIVCLIQTIAFELANVNNQFRTALIKTLENWGFQDVNESKKAMPNIEKLLQLFLEEPMEAWPKTLSVVVVIDALDEIKNISEDIHLLLGTFLRLLPVKLFITSRPEIKAKSMEISTATKKSSVALIVFHQNDKRNLEDVRLFAALQVDALFAEFPNFGPDNKKALEDMLVENSRGLFLWITLVLGNVDDDKIQRKNVDAHVRKKKNKLPGTSKVLAKRLEESASKGLQDLYCRAFSEAFLDVDDMEKEHQLKLFKASIGTLMVIKAPMSRDQLPYLVVGEDDDMFDEILASLEDISALLHVDDKDKLSFIHKTVQDYLIGIALAQDKIRCNNLASISALLSLDDKMKLLSIDKTVSDYHAGVYSWQLNSHECIKDVNFKLEFAEISFNLAIACLKLLNSDALFTNMAQLVGHLDHFNGNSDEWNVDNVLSESLQYAIFYWSDHLTDVFPHVDMQKQCQLILQLKLFCGNKLLNYLEAILLADRLEMVATMVNQVLLCLNVIELAASPSLSVTMKHSLLSSSASSSYDNPYSDTLLVDVAFICSILKDLKLVSINFRSQLLASPLQVYSNALTLVPQQTAYYHQYQKGLQVRLIMGGEQDWGPLSLSGHSYSLNSVAVTPDGKTIVSGSWDKTVK
ncbi:hypothetical protein HDU77_005490, partial [Chytriomyces hyalinus]